MARGGFRPGSGRKKGSVKKTEKTATKKPKVKKPVDEEKSKLDSEVDAIGKDAAKGVLTKDAKEFLESLLESLEVDQKTKIQVANILMPFQHARVGEGKGKKEEKADRAKAAGEGRFAPRPAPLRVVK